MFILLGFVVFICTLFFALDMDWDFKNCGLLIVGFLITGTLFCIGIETTDIPENPVISCVVQGYERFDGNYQGTPVYWNGGSKYSVVVMDEEGNLYTSKSSSIYNKVLGLEVGTRVIVEVDGSSIVDLKVDVSSVSE